MAELRGERKDINKMLKATRQFDVETRKWAKHHKETELIPELHVLEKSFKDLKSAVDVKQLAKAASEKELRETTKDFRNNASGNSLWYDVMEKCLMPHGFRKSFYHGGDAEGGPIQELMSQAKEAITDTRELLLNEFGDDRMKHVLITERLPLYQDCLVLWDGFFSLMRTREELYTDVVAEKAERFLTAGLDAWFRLGLTNKVSIHTMAAHAIGDLKFWRGLFKRNEEFMEQLHQVGITDALRTRGLTTIARKAEAIQKFYWLSSRSDVREQIQAVNDSRKRNFTTDRAAAGEAAKAGRELRRQETVERYKLGQPNLRDPTATITACDRTEDDLSSVDSMDTN